MKALVKVEREPMHFELAQWFLRSGEDLRSPEDIVEKICKIKESHDFAPGDVARKEYQGWIKLCREYLETKHKCTLVNVRFPGQQYGAYKIANDSEATLYGTRQYKQWIMKGERVRRITPLMKREYLLTSMKKVFGDLKEETERFRRLGEIFLPAYQEEIKQIERAQSEEEKKNGEVVRRK